MDPTRERKRLFERVGVQLQSSNYQGNIRVGEVCEEIAALYRLPADYHDLLSQFKLKQYLKQPVAKLSGDEKQKLSVLLALIPQPEVLFLDELTTGLDTEAYNAVLKWIENNGYEIIDNPRELYIDGVWNKDFAEDWLTEIQFPVRKTVVE